MTTRRYPSGIVGLPHPNNDGVLCHLVASLLATGDRVELRADPENRHDPGAVAVYATIEATQHHVGYVPARHAGWVGEAIRRGQGLAAIVGEIHRNARGHIVNVDLDIEVTRGAGRKAAA